MIALHRTTARPALAIIQSDQQVLVCPWVDLLVLRELYPEVTPDNRRVASPWIVAGRGGFTSLAHINQTTALTLDAADWRRIGELLYIGDDLLTVTEAARRGGRPRNSLYRAVAEQALFTFQRPKNVYLETLIPGYSLQQWLDFGENIPS